MTSFFVDTSALAKRYVVEIGSAWVRSWIDPRAGNVVLISALATVEMLSLLERRKREGTMAAQAVALLESDFQSHVDFQYLVNPVDAAVLDQARQLIRNHQLRTLDAVQLVASRQVV